ncbi:MAG: hypothetical protein APU95_05815 [Hadesarchaea archaeon YNP_N21]|jgi:hypothetical protein|nr:MAG: hypothetical protein APU95_05815 [Hadesarchaea archaeon YNP_N21]
MEEFAHIRWAPARDRAISEVKAGEERVRVLGLVVDKKEAEFTLDDGTGQIVVICEDPKLGENVELGSKVRVYGIPLIAGGIRELRAEIVQRMNGLDLQLYDEMRREIKKFERELQRI